jgi:hypothetical protein
MYKQAIYSPVVLAQMASFLLYLSDVEEGGETMFPFEVSQFKLKTSQCLFSLHSVSQNFTR